MLSNRELQVFELIGRGMNTIEIAHKLQVSPKTIESHRKVIKTKLNVENSANWRPRFSGCKRTPEYQFSQHDGKPPECGSPCALDDHRPSVPGGP